jgi:hypothetical protein
VVSDGPELIYIGQTMTAQRRLRDPRRESPHRQHGAPEVWDRVVVVTWPDLLQAKSRTHPSRPIRPGRPERREFEYVRPGTVSPLAAMDVTDGAIHPAIIFRNDSDTFIEFLTELDRALDPAKKIHLILDNGSSHPSTATRTWLADHPRFTVTYTP